MKGVIFESGFLAATNADILTATRLQTVPAAGTMLFQVQASDDDATNNYVIDIQLPNSDVPMVAVRVPAGRTAGIARLDSQMMLQYLAEINMGGRVVFGLTETGDAEAMYRVVFTPFAPY